MFWYGELSFNSLVPRLLSSNTAVPEYPEVALLVEHLPKHFEIISPVTTFSNHTGMSAHTHFGMVEYLKRSFLRILSDLLCRRMAFEFHSTIRGTVIHSCLCVGRHAIWLFLLVRKLYEYFKGSCGGVYPILWIFERVEIRPMATAAASPVLLFLSIYPHTTQSD